MGSFSAAVFEEGIKGLVAVTVNLASQLATDGLGIMEFDGNVYVAHIQQ